MDNQLKAMFVNAAYTWAVTPSCGRNTHAADNHQSAYVLTAKRPAKAEPRLADRLGASSGICRDCTTCLNSAKNIKPLLFIDFSEKGNLLVRNMCATACRKGFGAISHLCLNKVAQCSPPPI